MRDEGRRVVAIAFLDEDACGWVGVRVGGGTVLRARTYASAWSVPTEQQPLSHPPAGLPPHTRPRNKAGVARILSKQEEDEAGEAEAVTANMYCPQAHQLLKA